ncbi:outer membrane beta-barrel protein [Nibribacter ruber]|uniref:Outer membrane beta-barrel protein n=1 Tax=Nibribacter ruber TaxID=2698458 RepID=A0A6P1P2Q2_9BACT|nr:outer membrane beta-barrel protein [Nibribacter ruber]QHL88668.1 outer membrane beta-barrel protein [Nibribacter ruber]
MKESSAEENKQSRRVEDVFREGFDDAQVPPPSRLWDNLDQALENQELRRYRKQAFWYRSVAAACLLLLFMTGVFLWQQDQLPFWTGSPEGQLAKESSPANQQTENATAAPKTDSSQRMAASTNQDASIFSSIPEKQAKNDRGNPAQTRTSELMASADRSTATKTNSITSSASRFIAANRRNSAGKEKSAASANLPEENTPTLAISAPTQSGSQVSEVGTISLSGESSRVSGRTVISENAMAVSSRVAAASTNGLASDSLLNSRVATVLYQDSQDKVMMAKAEAEPSPTVLPEKTSSLKGWNVSLAYTPMYAYAPIAVGDAPNHDGMKMSDEQQQMYKQYAQALQEYKDSYTPAYSFTAKLAAGFQLNDHWQIESGVLYAQNEATTSHSFLITKNNGMMRVNSLVPVVNKPEPIVKAAFEPELANNLEAVTPTEQYRTRYKYKQVGLPLRLSYRKSISRVFAFVSGGVNLHLLLQNSIESENPEVQAKRYRYDDQTSPFRAWQWAAVTAAGLGYQLNQKMSITVAPELTYSFSSALKESQTQADPYQVGVSIGGKYRLSK